MPLERQVGRECRGDGADLVHIGYGAPACASEGVRIFEHALKLIHVAYM